MRLTGTDWLWTTAVILAGAAVCLAPSQVKADWTYQYQDDFRTDKAEGDSFLHSIFWPQGAFPPSEEAYVYYVDTGGQRELGFGDYNANPAYLGYCFPIGSEKSRAAVSGDLKIDVRFPDSADVASGYLQYQVSADGVNWSSPEQLEPGSNNIWIESVCGRCYVIFFGSEVLIDNLEVRLDSQPATFEVPRDFGTIQKAIDAASDGDIVEVSSGRYSDDGNWDIDFRGKAITVRSSSGPEQTTIDCSSEGGHRGFYFHRGEGPDSVLHGFTITGAVVPGSDIPPSHVNWDSSPAHPIGGGIYCEFSSPSIVDCVIRQCATELGGGIGSVGGEPTIIDCVIEQCRAGGQGPANSGGYGAGIGLIGGSDAEIINCTIEGNVGYVNGCGAGVYCQQSSALLVKCNISFNSAQKNLSGGGIYCEGSFSVVLTNCIISNNAAGQGGGIFASSADYVSVTNCTIAYNNLSEPPMSTSPGGGVHSENSDVEISNSIVWGNDGTSVLLDAASNSPVLFSDIEGYDLSSGQGNIDQDPLFASPADYHLKSILGRYEPGSGQWVEDADQSPCIDAGSPQDAIGPEPFPNSKRINMGAYGGTSEASMSIGPLIFHVDGANGSDSNTGLSRSDAFATIQWAVDQTYTGDTVMVWPWIYQEEVIFNGRGITLQSADDAAVVKAPNGYAFSFYGAESSMAVLRNFVITKCGEAAILCSGALPELTNLTIVDNQFGIYADGGANPNITNCILWNNKFGDLAGDVVYQPRISYSCLQQELSPIYMEEGNINQDPWFADSVNGDYHLQSEYGRYSRAAGWVTDSQTSPCIDSGDPSMHRGREPDGGRVNMGAYGGTPFASKSGPSW
jgi:hypothetical protein